jgi:hypothetical protein
MTRTELLLRLQIIKDRGNYALGLLDATHQTDSLKAEVQQAGAWLKTELENEYKRTSPEHVQRAMTLFELSVYSPTIEEAWKKSGISRLKVDSTPTAKWRDVLEAVVYTACKYVS